MHTGCRVQVGTGVVCSFYSVVCSLHTTPRGDPNRRSLLPRCVPGPRALLIGTLGRACSTPPRAPGLWPARRIEPLTLQKCRVQLCARVPSLEKTEVVFSQALGFHDCMRILSSSHSVTPVTARTRTKTTNIDVTLKHAPPRWTSIHLSTDLHPPPGLRSGQPDLEGGTCTPLQV